MSSHDFTPVIDHTVEEPLLDRQIAEFLAAPAQGFGKLAFVKGTAEKSWQIFVGEVPADQVVTTTVIEEGGAAPAAGKLWETRSFIVVTTAQLYQEAKARAQRTHRALHERQGILPLIRVARITADTNPITLGKDEAGRHRFTQTFTALVGEVKPA